MFRESAAVLDWVDLPGEGDLASRLWSRPAATVIGLDACPVDGAANAVPPSARARVSLRIAPGSDPQRQAAVDHHRRPLRLPGERVEPDHAAALRRGERERAAERQIPAGAADPA